MEPLSAVQKTFFTGTAIYMSEDFIDVADSSIVPGGMNLSFLQRFPLKKSTKNLSYFDLSGELDQIMEKAFPKGRGRPLRMAANIKNDELILRRFTIKNIPRNEVHQAVAFEAQKYIPSLIENLTYGFKSYASKENVHEIVFAAAETKNVREMVDYFREKNILLAIVEPVPILLARSLVLSKNLKKDAAYLFIHYEPFNKVTMCEVSHRYPYFTREIMLTSDEEIEPADRGSELTYPTLKSVWPKIEREVSGGMDYIRKEAKEKVEKIFISGFEPSPDEGTIAHELGVPCERPDLSFFKGFEAEKKDRYLPILMLLHDCQQTPALNIAPENVTRTDLWTLKAVFAKTLIILAGIILAHFIMLGVNNQISGVIANAKKGMIKYKGVDPNTSKNDILSYRDTVLRKAILVNNLVAKKHYLTEKLILLGELLPRTAWVDSVTYTSALSEDASSASLALRGYILGGFGLSAASPNTIAENIKRDKKMMEGFREVSLSAITKKEVLKKEVTEFGISLD